MEREIFVTLDVMQTVTYTLEAIFLEEGKLSA
jgi:hypothetical protein